MSIPRVQGIIDRCVSSYLQSYLEEPEPQDSYTESPLRRRGASEGHQRNRPYGTSRLDTRSPSPLSDFNSLSVADKNLSGYRNSSANDRDSEIGATDSRWLSVRQRSQRSESLTVPRERGSFSRSSQSANGSQSGRGLRPCVSIFRPLEDYIMASFNGCDAMNASFCTVKPRTPRAASEGDQPSTNPDPEPAPTALSDAPLSPLDPKTLLLGDIADNGSWWTGNRRLPNPPSKPSKPSEGHRKKWTHDNAGGLVSSRTPRIDWAEVAEWYRLIMHAGESWHDKWVAMKPGEFDSEENAQRNNRWESMDLSLLENEISASKFHTRTILLRATESLLQRPKRPLKRPEDIRFLLIVLANPLLYSTEANRGQPLSAPTPDPKTEEHSRPKPNEHIPGHGRSRSRSTPQGSSNSGRFLIVKRIVGLLSNLPTECHHLLVSWFSRFTEGQFRRIVELIGSFVTYLLTKEHKRRRNKPQSFGNNLDEYVPTFSNPGGATPAQVHDALHREKASKSTNGETNPFDYGGDWQVEAAAKVMAMLFSANNTTHARKRDNNHPSPFMDAKNGPKQIVPLNTFYNTYLDYCDLVADFEAWESRKGKFSFCQYSFFISIWAKIRIMEHDARRQMEAKAREAFFDSILGRKGVSQYLVLRVRRDCLAEDSLRVVSQVVGSGAEEIKKGLRIEFTGEEGVDAGGLRKEWFLLLVREVFDPLHGKFKDILHRRRNYYSFAPRLTNP